MIRQKATRRPTAAGASAHDGDSSLRLGQRASGESNHHGVVAGQQNVDARDPQQVDQEPGGTKRNQGSSSLPFVDLAGGTLTAPVALRWPGRLDLCDLVGDGTSGPGPSHLTARD